MQPEKWLRRPCSLQPYLASTLLRIADGYLGASCKQPSLQVPPPPSSTIPTQITSLSLNNTRLVYGQQELFGTRIQVAAGSPVPQGSITFFNGSTVLASGSLTGPGAVVSGNGVVRNN